MLALSIVERLVHWIEPAFTAAGYWIIAAGVLMERSIFVGLIIPGDVILALGGVFSSQHKMKLTAVIAVGSALRRRTTPWFMVRPRVANTAMPCKE